MLELWDDLEVWSVRDKNGELGLFTARVLGGWIHVGLPIAQTILTDPERRSLPQVFAEAGLDATSLPPDPELARVLRVYGSGRLRHKTLTVLERTDEELYRALIDTVADELADWDGTVYNIDEPVDGPSHRYGTVRLCVRVDPVSGSVRATARCHINSEFPEGRLVLTTPALSAPVCCDEFVSGWSTPLSDATSNETIDASSLDWAEGAVLKETAPSSTWRLQLPGRSVRILEEGSSEGLPGLVETYHLPASRPFFLLFAEKSWHQLEQWVQEGCAGFSEYTLSEGLPPGWRLAVIDGVVSDKRVRDAFPWLATPARPRIRLRGGLRRARGDTYFSFAPPDIAVDGGDGTEEVVCEGRALRPSRAGVYKLPSTAPLDSRIAVQIRRAGQVVARRSLYLTADFPWQRDSPLNVLDEWGRPSSNTVPPAFQMAGAAVDNPGYSPGRFAIPVQMTPGLEGTEGRVFLLGRAPGQIVRWPGEAIPQKWKPVWAVPLRRRGRALYCGTGIDISAPLAEPHGDRGQILAWKDVLWRRRKRITPPEQRLLRKLWREYQEVARRV